MEPGFDPTTGEWTTLRVDGRNLLAGPGADIGIVCDKGVLPPIAQWRLVSIRDDGKRTIVTRQAGDWEISTETSVSGDEVRRSATLRWMGTGTARVTGTALRVPNLRLSSSRQDYYSIPGNFPVVRHPFSGLVSGHVTSEQGWTRGEYGIALLNSAKCRISIVVGYDFESDQARVSVEEEDGAVSIVHRFDTLARLKHADEIKIGEQVLTLVRGNEDDLMRGLADLSDRLRNGPPPDRPEHLKKCVLYEVHPWGRLETWQAGDKGNRFPRLTSLLPYYKELGVTALWLMPVSWPPPWVYTTPDFESIAPGNGTPEELKALVDQTHRLGMKMIIDLVVYGLYARGEAAKKMPEDVWCRDENNQPVLTWSDTVKSADCSNATWQKIISEAVTRWARDYGFDGTRLDCIGWGQAPNWGTPLRANASMAKGGLELNKVVRDSMRAANPDAVTLPEGGKPLVFRNADLLFDYPLYLAMRDMTATPDLPLWIRQVREWLQFERHCYPRRALPGLVRFLENHDTVCPAQLFGVGPSQALMAICSLIQGTPLLYQEQEIGFSEDLSRWLKLRNTEKCFYDGSADYLATKCSDPEVFSFLRLCDEGAAAVAVNLTGRKVVCDLSWPADLAKRFPATSDGLSGQPVAAKGATARVVLPPYRPTIVLLKAAGAQVRPIAAESTPPPRVRFAEPADGRVKVNGARSWFVQTDDGRLEDAFRDYGAKPGPDGSVIEQLPVLRRAWNPLESAMLEGSREAAIGVVNTQGEAVALRVDPPTARDVRICNPRCNGDEVELVALPVEGRSASADAREMMERVSVTPQFVHLVAGQNRLSLARRHGGAPAGLAVGANLMLGFGDLYTDRGIVPNDGFASADGNTAPSFSISETSNSSSVTFEGRLHARSWNGVQTAPTAEPRVDYRLKYSLTDLGGVSIEVSAKPSVNVPHGPAFLALRVQLIGYRGWRRGSESGRAGDSAGARAVQCTGPNSRELEIELAAGWLTVPSAEAGRNVFVVDAGDGNAYLYLALLDGEQEGLKAGHSLTAKFDLAIQAE